jgi:gliding motility-associated-like protein
MKKFVFSILLFTLLSNAFAAHIKGGFLTYKYLGPGTAANTLKYKITLTIYMVCNPSTGQLTNPINITIFNGNGPTIFDNVSVGITNQYNLGKAYDEPCITDDQRGCYYTIVVYDLSSYDLPISANGYTISYQRCCRIANMDNVANSAQVGNTYTTKIPGTSSPIPDANKNSSPEFTVNDTAVICGGSFFSLPLGATDADGDSLSYTLCGAYDGGTPTNPIPDPAEAPGYNTVTYEDPYSGFQPMGGSVKIDSKTGLLSGVAPPIAFSGEYVVTVCVAEYRKGLLLGESRKELHIRVQDCVPLKALLNPKPVTCDGFSITFSNDVENQSGTNYEWNFGDTSSGIKNTSTEATPSHNYTDTGVYTVRLKVSIAGLCADSTSTVVKVYPGFFPAFKINPPYCRNTPVQLVDETTSKYGIPTGWRWNFGDNTSIDSTNKNIITHSYINAGTYDVMLIVGNTFGCVDSIKSQVTIAENPTLSVTPKDTSYCSLDTLTLTATGTGVFNWSPASNIIGANTSTAKAFPKTTTKYFVSLTSNGCINRDSVLLRPVNNVTNSISTLSNNVCEGDTISLNGSSNYSNVKWQWKPSAAVLNPADQSTQAIVTANGQFILTTRWGNNCLVSDTQNITVKPLAIANAGKDTFICKGQNSVILNATGGIRYQWTPVAGLSNPNIANPVAIPTATTTYSVAVSVAGCSAARSDEVTITVRDLPATNLTNDTLICSIDTLQLKTNAAGTFVWSPNYNISSLTSPNPFISPDVPTRYFVRLTDPFGCINTDSVYVNVKLFVTLEAGKDTTICRTDGIKLNPQSDALTYQWSPSGYLDDANVKQPVATPTVQEITYTVIGNIGKCQSRDVITIKTVPYPVPDAGTDVKICYGTSTQLTATGGRNYTWSPAVFLDNANTANPLVVNATATVTYRVAVTDILGCPKPVTDSVVVFVRNPVQATTGFGSDTSIVIGQTLQFNASGGELYNWNPAAWLSGSDIPNPLAAPEDDIEYRLTVTTVPEGCVGLDTLKVKVFKVPPSFYVPTAFSPNGDGRNEVLRPIALGMKSVKYFRVFSRAGLLLFSTTEKNKGWDGTYKGNPQDPGTYVWAAEGVTYQGAAIVRKGTAVLVR